MILGFLAWAAIGLQVVTGLWLWRANSSASKLSPLPPTINHILSTAAAALVLVVLLIGHHIGFLFWFLLAMVVYSSWNFMMKLTKR